MDSFELLKLRTGHILTIDGVEIHGIDRRVSLAPAEGTRFVYVHKGLVWVNSDGTIVDGFHRWTVSADLDSTDVPVVVLARKSRSDRQISTVRHNRARGTHAVLKMADIVGGMVESGMPLEEICRRLGMEPEEVVRLSNRKGIPKTKIVVQSEWSKAWEPE